LSELLVDAIIIMGYDIEWSVVECIR
jgi:hypothetical protein